MSMGFSENKTNGYEGDNERNNGRYKHKDIKTKTKRKRKKKVHKRNNLYQKKACSSKRSIC